MDPHGPDDLARRMSEAVHALVAVWVQAPAAVTPRVSAHQLRALHVVDRTAQINLTGLADELGMTLPAASRLCDRLEAAGLLARDVPPHNRREVLLRLTSRGSRLLDEVADRRRRDLAAVLGTMPAPRRTELLSGLLAFHTAHTAARTPPARRDAP